MTIAYTELLKRRDNLRRKISLLHTIVAADPTDSTARGKLVELMAELIGVDATISVYTDIGNKLPGN